LRGAPAGWPGCARRNLKTWERIAEKARELPPERQQEVLDFVEFVLARDAQASPPPGSDTPRAPPEPRIAGDAGASSWGPGRSFGMDTLQLGPPRRRGGRIAGAAALGLALLAVATYLLYRFGRSPEQPGDAVARGADAGPATAAVGEVAAGPADAEPPAPPLLAMPDAAPAPDVAGGSALPLIVTTAPAPPPDGAPGAGVTDGGDATGELDALPSPATALACGDALSEARELWRRRDRPGALQKLRDAMACDPAAVEPRLQWGRWVTDTPALFGDRAVCAEGAAALRPAAEANPDRGELWFHYTNLLFGAGQREAAQAAKEHCMGIRPRDDYSSTCRFLPQ
jgi:hypothetical protein